MLRRITILTVTAVSLHFLMVTAAWADLITVTDAEQYVGAGIGYLSDGTDYRVIDELVPDPPQGPGDADLNISLAQYGVSVSGSLTSVFEEDHFTANGSCTASSEWGDNPSEAKDVHGGSGSRFVLHFTRGSSPAYFSITGQINVDINGHPDIYPDETSAYVKLSSDDGGSKTTAWEVALNGQDDETSLPVDHGLWLEAGQSYILEAYTKSGTTTASEYSTLNSRSAGFSLTATIDENDSSDRYFLKEYLPLEEGITWNYLQTYADGHRDYEVFCIGGTEPVNGVLTHKQWEFDSGELAYCDYWYDCTAWTEVGLKTYKGVCSDGSYITCDPPLIQYPTSIRIGETFTNSCTITEHDAAGNVVGSWPYSRELTLEAAENVEVLASNFARCLKFSGTEEDEGDTAEFIIWLAPGIGEVKRVFPGDEGRELISLTGQGKTYSPAD